MKCGPCRNGPCCPRRVAVETPAGRPAPQGPLPQKSRPCLRGPRSVGRERKRRRPWRAGHQTRSTHVPLLWNHVSLAMLTAVTRVSTPVSGSPPPQHVHEPLPVAFCLMLVPLRDDHLACRDEFRHHSLPAGPCRSFQREQPSSPSPAAPRERGHLRSPTSPKCTTRGGRSVNTRGLYRLVAVVESGTQ